MTDGDSHERAFARFFDQAGYFVQRAGASGSGNFAGNAPGPTDDRAQPDVLVGGDGDLFLFEMKSGGSGSGHYWTSDEVAPLKWAAKQVGGYALGVSRFPRDSFRIWDLDVLHETKSGSRRAQPRDDPLAVLADPRSKADDPPGYTPEAVAYHSLGRIIQANEADPFNVTPGDVGDADLDDVVDRPD